MTTPAPVQLCTARIDTGPLGILVCEHRAGHTRRHRARGHRINGRALLAGAEILVRWR